MENVMLVPLISGFIAGIAGGMGIGGGALLIPALTLFGKIEQHTAQSANLIFFIPTALSALVIHIKNKSIDIKKALIMSSGGIAGALLGSAVANFTDGAVLRKMFAVFLAVFGIAEIMRKEEK